MRLPAFEYTLAVVGMQRFFPAVPQTFGGIQTGHLGPSGIRVDAEALCISAINSHGSLLTEGLESLLTRAQRCFSSLASRCNATDYDLANQEIGNCQEESARDRCEGGRQPYPPPPCESGQRAFILLVYPFNALTEG